MVRQQLHGASALAVLLVILVSIAACTAAPAPVGSSGASAGLATSAAPADGAAVAAAATILKATHLGDPVSVTALQGIRLTDAGTQAAGDVLRAGATGDTLWAATYVYASGGGDPAVLRPIVADASASATVRAMAAAALLGGGDATGFDPLIAALSGTDRMDGSDPPGFVWEFAADVLERYAHQGLGPTLTTSDAERATAAAKWKSWLDTNRAKLRFDTATQLWVTA
jgi:hypothetical protein